MGALTASSLQEGLGWEDCWQKAEAPASQVSLSASLTPHLQGSNSINGVALESGWGRTLLAITEEERTSLLPLEPEIFAFCSLCSRPFGKQLQPAPLSGGRAFLNEAMVYYGTIVDRRPLRRAPADLGFL